MNCRCDDIRHDTLATTAWHRAYCNWYDARAAGHRYRAAAWGALADRLAPHVRTA
jgi:hypothetical protein